MPNWKKIKAEYVRGHVSYRKLAEKYGVSFSTLRQMAAREKWTDLRDKRRIKADTKIVDAMASREAQRADKLQSVADMLLDRIAEGVEEGTLVRKAMDIRNIAASLKDLKEVKGYKTELDMQEQIARIEKLRKEVSSDPADNTVIVQLDGDLAAYAR